MQEAEGTDEDIDRAVQRALQRAIAAEASLAAAVVAGEVTLVADDEVELSQSQEPQQDPAEAQEEAAARQGGQRQRLRRGHRPDPDQEVRTACMLSPHKAPGHVYITGSTCC